MQHVLKGSACRVLAVSLPCASRVFAVSCCSSAVLVSSPCNVFAVILHCICNVLALILSYSTVYCVLWLATFLFVPSPYSHILARRTCRVHSSRVFCFAPPSPRLPITGRAALSVMDLSRQIRFGQSLRPRSATPPSRALRCGKGLPA